MKGILLLYSFIAFFFFCQTSSLAQTPSKLKENDTTNTQYAYVRMEEKTFSRVLNVSVDLGDSEQEISLGEEYSKILSQTKSRAQVLNFLAKKGYILNQTFTLNLSENGDQGRVAIVCILKKTTPHQPK